ncbi:MAG: ABC transporter ATP-binding protein/permease, partial [Clostridia bacterium]|nr:ABC transporter ATP-binding protein/permease [Clostridia bacterium]
MSKERKVRKILVGGMPAFWGYVVFSFVFALAIQGINLIPPILMGEVIDKYIPNSDLKTAAVCIGVFTLIPIISTALNTIYNYSINIVGRKMGQYLTLLGFERIIERPIDYFDNQNSAEVVSYCKKDSMNYVLFWIMDMPKLFAGLVSGLFVYFFIVKINVFIALGALLYIPFSLLPNKFFSKKIEKYIKKVVENNAKANQVMTDTFQGIKFVKSMLLENDRMEKLRAINESTVKIWGKTVAIDNLNGSWVNDLSDSLFLGLGFSVSAVLIIKGYITIGMLVLLLNYLPKFFSSVKSIAHTNFNFKKQLAEYDRFFELITSDEKAAYEGGEKSFKMEKEIVFENVSFAYSKERGSVLNSLSLRFPKNKWIGIVGKSGAGKTTIFDLLLKFYGGYSGKITVDGAEIGEISAKSVRENVTKVSQDMFLFPGTIKDNLIMVRPSASEEELREAVKDVGLDEFLSKLPNGIDTEIGENGVQLSGGEKQRLCLAQGLLRKSKV